MKLMDIKEVGAWLDGGDRLTRFVCRAGDIGDGAALGIDGTGVMVVLSGGEVKSAWKVQAFKLLVADWLKCDRLGNPLPDCPMPGDDDCPF